MAISFAPTVLAAPYGLSSRTPVAAFLNGQMPATRPGVGSGDYTVIDAFPNLTFEDPTFMIAEPNTNRIYVCGRQGTIHWFVNSPDTATKTLFLNITNRTQGYEDCGLVGFAFHPEWRVPTSTNRGHIFVWYQYTTNRVFPPPDGDRPDALHPGMWMRLSRFRVPDGQLTVDPNSEVVLINQYDRHMWHGGGAMFFGPDGFLYVTVGDEGGIDDEFHQAQRNNGGLFSGVLRIDVNSDPTRSHPIRRQPQSPPGGSGTFTANYYIPNDNPWLDPSGSILEEFWAVGLRSPHRMTLDPVTGQIWQGDIGQNAREEINLIERGGNYQWAYREGNLNGPFSKPAPLVGVDKPPVYDYPRDNLDTCVIVGYVYRGASLPELNGKLIFGDNTSGRVWSLAYNGSNNAPAVTYLCNIPPGVNYNGLSSFGLDNNGEIYALQMGRPGGKLWKLARTGPPAVSAPALLSQTGAFANTTNLTPNPALIPYDVNSPLWSDGAEKQRWMAVPNNGAPYTSNEQIAFAPAGEWSFPSGTVFVKHFDIATNDSNPTLRRRLETRLLVRDTNSTVYGLTYRWRANNSDADLVTNSINEDIVIRTPSGTRTQTWFYPSPQDCLTCHTPVAGHVLGVKTRQLNGDFAYPSSGNTDNQLRALNHIGLFTPALSENSITNYAKLVRVTDTNATLETRVRSYLDANCAQCHRPGGVVANFDARFDTPLVHQNILNGAVNNNFGMANAREVAPGSVARSIMHLRVNTNSIAKMPPIARNVIDTNFVPVLADWINSFVPGSLPSPWQHQDIGAVAVTGSAGYITNTATFTVTGSGLDIWNNADEFHYAYVNAGGDCEVIARVTSITETFEWAKAGLMIRETLAPGSRNACLALTPANGVEYQWRETTAGSSFYVQGPLVSAPHWLKLARTNNVFTAYESADGTNWSQVGSSITIAMSSNTVAGLAVSAVNDGTLNTSTFDFVRVNSAATADSDSDGMPDSYEIAHGFNRFDANDAGQDADSDRMTNLHEFFAGTNPRNVNSVLRLTRVNRLSNDVVLGFLAGTGKTFIIERGTNLPITTWLTVTNVISGTNSNLTVTNRGSAANPQNFYRVRVAP